MPALFAVVKPKRIRNRVISESEKVRNRERALEYYSVPENRERQRLASSARYYAPGNAEKWKVYNRKRRGLPAPTRPAPQLCECCGNPPGQYALALDHCHATGLFRGWLCGRCNVGIGGLGDSVEGLRRAIDYLERNSADLL